ncbi:hypothetical protein BASA62_006251 [Batrachochytrium salamandrivorans]|nr:hypothetical protein BASA62_006251 [Batrachochytrium salamandrivorans]
MIIRSLLVNELKDTKSVMYDLRGNSGGNVEFANNMVQLFKPDFKPFGDRYLMNKITHNIFSANTMGQVYLRPMGVLNDGRCYSSCEVFSGAIQGHGAGIIFGEDGRTGGGGASVMELDPFLIRVSPTYFQKFPFTQELTSGSTTYANTLSVGVTQTVRTGLYKNQDIEDAGIEPHIIFRPQWSDLQPGSTTNTQYDRIAKSLARIGRKNGISDSVGLYQPSTTAPADGWNNLKGPWMIGNGVKYASNVESSIEAFFTAPIGTKINVGIDVALDTKPDCDFLYLSIKSSGGIEDFPLRSKSLDGTKTFNGISGRGITVKGTAPFTTKSERFSVSLKFTF